MRVLHVVGAAHDRGAERVARNLIDALQPVGVESRLVALVPGDPRNGSLPVDGILAPRARDRFRWFPGAVVTLRRELREHPADVVLAHGALAAVVAASAGGPPVIWHRILELPAPRRLDPQRALKRVLARRIAGVVAITERTGGEARELGFRGPIWHIPNHRPAPAAEDVSSETGSAVRRELGVPAEAPLVTSVGHLTQQKHPEDTIAVFAAVAAMVPTARFLVAGDGELHDRVAAQAERVLPGRVQLLGYRTDVDRLLAASDVVVLTSRSDSMPGMVIEAQMAGCPIVSYPVDGIAEVQAVGISGLVTERRDPAEAATAVVSLLRDPDRRRAMAVAATSAVAHLTTAAAVPRYRAMFDAVARSPIATRPLRVLHVVPDLGVGGAERALAVVAATGPTDGSVSHTVAAIGGARRPLDETVHAALQANGVGFCDLGVRRRPTRSPIGLAQASRRLRRLARRMEIDVVDAALLDATLPSRLALGRFGRVAHLVGMPYSPAIAKASGGPAWRRRVLQCADAATVRRDDVLVALTRAVADETTSALRLSAGTRIEVIPRGVDTKSFAPTGVDRDPHRIVSIGRLVPSKGHATLIEAVAAARVAGHPLHLVIAGEGPQQRQLETLISRLGMDEHVDLVGPVLDVRPLLATGGVFALATVAEGQSNAVLEAMAMGCAVVVGDVPALREVVSDAGVLVAPDDRAAWTEALVALAAEPVRAAALGEAARARAVDEFDARRRTAELLDLYRGLRR